MLFILYSRHLYGQERPNTAEIFWSMWIYGFGNCLLVLACWEHLKAPVSYEKRTFPENNLQALFSLLWIYGLVFMATIPLVYFRFYFPFLSNSFQVIYDVVLRQAVNHGSRNNVTYWDLKLVWFGSNTASAYVFLFDFGNSKTCDFQFMWLLIFSKEVLKMRFIWFLTYY